jgi:hypothetical protein
MMMSCCVPRCFQEKPLHLLGACCCIHTGHCHWVLSNFGINTCPQVQGYDINHASNLAPRVSQKVTTFMPHPILISLDHFFTIPLLTPFAPQHYCAHSSSCNSQSSSLSDDFKDVLQPSSLVFAMTTQMTSLDHVPEATFFKYFPPLLLC